MGKSPRAVICGAALLLAALMSGCTTEEKSVASQSANSSVPLPPPPPPPPAGFASVPSPAPVELGYRMATPTTLPRPMPVGIVLLKQDDGAGGKRNRRFCEFFFSTVKSAASLDETDANVMQTFWLVRTDIRVPEGTDQVSVQEKCERVLANYDFPRAREQLAQLPSPGIGPFLIAIGGPNEPKEKLLLDASTVKDENLDSFVLVWKGVVGNETARTDTPPVQKPASKPVRKKNAPSACPGELREFQDGDYILKVSINRRVCEAHKGPPPPHHPIAPHAPEAPKTSPTLTLVKNDLEAAGEFACKAFETSDALKLLESENIYVTLFAGTTTAICNGLVSDLYVAAKNVYHKLRSEGRV